MGLFWFWEMLVKRYLGWFRLFLLQPSKHKYSSNFSPHFYIFPYPKRNQPMKHIFINYRMQDTAFEAANLKQIIENRFKDVTVFKDTESMQAGEDLDDKIKKFLEKADIVLSLVDPNWLKHKHPFDPFLNLLLWEDDWVRKEIEHLYDCGKIDCLIPVAFRNPSIPTKEAAERLLPKKLQCFSNNKLYHFIRKESPEGDLKKL